MPISHIGLNVRDMDEATSFYSAALKPLGYKMRMEFVDGEVRGFGASACGPDFWLAGPNAPGADGSETRHQRGGVEGKTEVKEEARRKLSGPVHVAFAAKDRGKVRSFYEEAL
jgi:catechol 2,3-dioxygenase-like lactoylglutathione lyase family enzyme